jgi:hypothetical protein
MIEKFEDENLKSKLEDSGWAQIFDERTIRLVGEARIANWEAKHGCKWEDFCKEQEVTLPSHIKGWEEKHGCNWDEFCKSYNVTVLQSNEPENPAEQMEQKS